MKKKNLCKPQRFKFPHNKNIRWWCNVVSGDVVHCDRDIPNFKEYFYSCNSLQRLFVLHEICWNDEWKQSG